MLLIDLTPQLLGEVPGCPDITAMNALRNAAIEFCEKADAWVETQDGFQLQDLVSVYDVDAPAGAQVVRVMQAWVDGREVFGKPQEEVDRLVPAWRTQPGNLPLYFNSPDDPALVKLYPTPSNLSGQQIVLRVAYAPSALAKSIPTSLGNKHLETLLAGAKARLMAMPNKAWSNATLAGYHGEVFANAITSKRIAALHSGVRGSLTVKPVRFG